MLLIQSVLANFKRGINLLQTLENNINNPQHVKVAVQQGHNAINDANYVLGLLGKEPYNRQPEDYSHFTEAVNQSRQISEEMLTKVGSNGHDSELSNKDLELILNGAKSIQNRFDNVKIKIAPMSKYNLVGSDATTGKSRYEGTYESLDKAIKIRDSNNARFSSDKSKWSDDPIYIWNVYDDKGFVVKQ